MARSVFYSFDYERDAWRVQQVKNMGVLAGQPILKSNEWEKVTGGTDRGIKKWIDEKMEHKSCLVVLIGSRTSSRKWVRYEIQKAWNEGRGVVGIHIHNLEDRFEQKATKGSNPFWQFTVGRRQIRMSTVARVYDPPYTTGPNVYKWIESHIPVMVEEGIKNRNNFSG